MLNFNDFLEKAKTLDKDQFLKNITGGGVIKKDGKWYQFKTVNCHRMLVEVDNYN